jgi:hypothetical protein
MSTTVAIATPATTANSHLFIQYLALYLKDYIVDPSFLHNATVELATYERNPAHTSQYATKAHIDDISERNTKYIKGDIWTIFNNFKKSESYQNLLKETTMIATPAAEVTVESPETLAAKDVRLLDIIENTLLDHSHKTELTDDLVFSIQEYMCNNSSSHQSALALIAERAKLRGVFKIVQQIKNSPEFLDLVALNTPDEELSAISSQRSLDPSEGQPSAEVVAVGTTAAEVVAAPLFSMEELYNLSVKDTATLLKKVKKDPKFTQALLHVTEKSKTTFIKHELAFAVHSIDYSKYVAPTSTPTTAKPAKATKAPKQAKTSPSVPMPTIASVEALEAMTRPELAKAIQALNWNVKTSVRANGANTLMMETLAKHVLKLPNYKAPTKPKKAPKTPKEAKAPKASKSKVQEVLNLPEGFSWDEAKNMNYRQLQGICKILRSQGLYEGNLAGKGVNKDHLKSVVADYFRSQGVEIIEANLTPSTTPKAELHLPNLAQARESQRLERVTTQALKLNNEDAKVALEMAVAA